MKFILWKCIAGEFYFKLDDTISVKFTYKNDAGKNITVLSGIFSDRGIKNHDFFSKATCDIINAKSIVIQKLFLDYYEVCGDSFLLYLTSITHFLNKPLTSIYSSSCRAFFGDKRCGIIPKKSQYSIIDINHDILTLNSIVNNIFLGGTALINQNEYLICEISLQKITLDKPLSNVSDIVTLSENCDKHYNSCIKFNNTINFRGEPFAS